MLSQIPKGSGPGISTETSAILSLYGNQEDILNEYYTTPDSKEKREGELVLLSRYPYHFSVR